MEKETAVFIKNKDINTIITDKYLNKGCYDTFDNVISLSNTKSVISASIGFGMFGVRTLAYIDNLFEFLDLYNDCHKDIDLNLLACIDHNKMSNSIGFDIFSSYGIKYSIIGRKKNNMSLEDLLTCVIKDKESGIIVLRS